MYLLIMYTISKGVEIFNIVDFVKTPSLFLSYTWIRTYYFIINLAKAVPFLVDFFSCNPLHIEDYFSMKWSILPT